MSNSFYNQSLIFKPPMGIKRFNDIHSTYAGEVDKITKYFVDRAIAIKVSLPLYTIEVDVPNAISESKITLPFGVFPESSLPHLKDSPLAALLQKFNSELASVRQVIPKELHPVLTKGVLLHHDLVDPLNLSSYEHCFNDLSIFK